MVESSNAPGGKASGQKSSAQKEMNGSEKSAKESAGKSAGVDAIELLKADHREVEGLFEQYENASRRAEKSKIAKKVCNLLQVHTIIEEEIFYPACREHLEDDMLDEAQVEHDTAKALIVEILAGDPREGYYDAKVKVLSELIKHHVKEEEQRGEGIFAKAKAAGLDSDELSERLQARKSELMEVAEGDGLGLPETRSFEHQDEARPAAKPRARAKSAVAPREDSPRDEDRGGTSRAERASDDRSFRDEDDRRRSPREASRSNPDDRRDRARSEPRDERGRFIDEHDDRARYARSRGEDRGSYRREDEDRLDVRRRDRDEEGRFRSDDDRRRDEGQGGWFGDPEGHARAARKGWDDRH